MSRQQCFSGTSLRKAWKWHIGLAMRERIRLVQRACRDKFSRRRLRSFMMFLLSLFGGLALFLAGVGIYGVIAYAVSQRTREIGVRMAMGAQPGQVLTMVLGEALKLVLTGLLFGVAAALMLMRLLEGLVYGVGMHDPLVFISVNLVMLFVALVACYVPARRAARVDPLVALRYE